MPIARNRPWKPRVTGVYQFRLGGVWGFIEIQGLLPGLPGMNYVYEPPLEP